MGHFRLETRRVRTRQVPEVRSSPPAGPTRSKKERGRFTRAIAAGTGALVALGIGSALGDVHGRSLHEKLFALLGALAFLVLAVTAVQSAAGSLGKLVAIRAGRSGATAVMVVTGFVGYVIVLFVALGLLDVPVQHLLLGGALTGVVVGIAAQQALGNVFAGLVLLIARPFTLDERVRIRAGALGGIFEGVVKSMTLAYVTIETDEGAVNVPNSALLAAAVGPAPREDVTDLTVANSGAPPVEPRVDFEAREPRHPLARAARVAGRSHRRS
ncbi:MAG: mechanosensitive ion channel domain-containing protein [Acidimicrobiales bacterium]